MDWLTNNPIANLPGPMFLVLYLLVILATYAFSRWQLAQSDPSRQMAPLDVPTNPDPLEIAYLRGGDNELLRVAIFGLLQRGHLHETTTSSGFLRRTERRLEKAPNPPDLGALSPVERGIYDYFIIPRTPSEIFATGGLPGRLQPLLQPYEERLAREHLLAAPAMSWEALRVGLLAAAVIAGLGGYKLLVALDRGRTNVDFLIIMGAIALLLLPVALRVPRLSARGRQYLARLQTAFTYLRNQATQVGGFDPTLLLLVGVFGVGALAGTPFGYYQEMFRQGSSGGSCGSSTGGCGSGDGGSGGCGGCGGGGD